MFCRPSSAKCTLLCSAITGCSATVNFSETSEATKVEHLSNAGTIDGVADISLRIDGVADISLRIDCPFRSDALEDIDPCFETARANCETLTVFIRACPWN